MGRCHPFLSSWSPAAPASSDRTPSIACSHGPPRRRARQLLDRQAREPRALSRSPRLHVVVCDVVARHLRRARADHASSRPVERIVHLAAQVSVVAVGRRTRSSTCRSTTAARCTCSSTRARRGVEEGRVRVVGRGLRRRRPSCRSARTRRCRPVSPYGIDKLASEHALDYYASVHGVPTTALRFFNVYGPRQDPSSPYSGVISIFADRARAGRPLTIFGDGEQTRDFVYVGDVVRAIVAALGDGNCAARRERRHRRRDHRARARAHDRRAVRHAARDRARARARRRDPEVARAGRSAARRARRRRRDDARRRVASDDPTADVPNGWDWNV